MQSVMFIPLGFYNYDKKISRTIQSFGYKVTQFTPIGNYNAIQKLINAATGGRFLRHKCRRRQIQYLLNTTNSYDYVLVIVGRHLDYDILKAFRRRQPHAKFILYLWDDVKRVENFEQNKELYDEIYSFDLEDVSRYGFKHLPLFYTDVHEYHGESKTYTLNLCGIIHSERLAIWDKIVTRCNLDVGKCFLFLLGTQIKHFIQTIFPGKNRWMKRKYIHIHGMGYEDMANIMKHSVAALDVQFGSQCGLTMRTLESLGAHTKLITTNPYVKQYDFYQYGNICVIDRENPQIPDDFFSTEYQDVPDEIAEQYTLGNWVHTMLGDARQH